MYSPTNESFQYWTFACALWTDHRDLWQFELQSCVHLNANVLNFIHDRNESFHFNISSNRHDCFQFAHFWKIKYDLNLPFLLYSFPIYFFVILFCWRNSSNVNRTRKKMWVNLNMTKFARNKVFRASDHFSGKKQSEEQNYVCTRIMIKKRRIKRRKYKTNTQCLCLTQHIMQLIIYCIFETLLSQLRSLGFNLFQLNVPIIINCNSGNMTLKWAVNIIFFEIGFFFSKQFLPDCAEYVDITYTLR